VTGSIEATPLVAATLTVKFGVVMPSAGSLAVSVPVIAPASSSPVPLVLPPNTAGSLTWLTVTVTVAVSVTPPEVTV